MHRSGVASEVCIQLSALDYRRELMHTGSFKKAPGALHSLTKLSAVQEKEAGTS